MSSRFKKRLEQLHGSRQRRRASRLDKDQADSGQPRVFTADGVDHGSDPTGALAADALADDTWASKWRQQGAKTRATPRGGAYFLAREHPQGHQHGKRRLIEGAATELSCFRDQLNDPRLHSTDPRRLAFLDLETNGLSKTSFPFCIGIGLWEGPSFTVYHYFTPSDEDEPSALSACAQILGDVDGLCTFNGSSFDVRMLERRFRQHGIEHPLDTLAHLDLLHLARKLWPTRKTHKLSRLEEDELGFRRQGDIPGAKIPRRWQKYQKVGDPRLLLDIFDHNRLDILSMVTLIAELAGPAAEPVAGPIDSSAGTLGRGRTERDAKPRTKLTSRLSRSYSLRDKVQRDRAQRDQTPRDEAQQDERPSSTLDASFSRSELRKGMPIGTRLRELRAEVERLQREGDAAKALARLHEMVALAPRNPFALQGLVDHYRHSGDAALAAHFVKRLDHSSPF